MADASLSAALDPSSQAGGNQAQFNLYLQEFRRLVIAAEALAQAETLYRQFPWNAAGNLVLATQFPSAVQGTVIIDQTVPAALSVTLNGAGPWIIADGAGVAAANNITVQGAGGNTILGAATYVMSTNWAAATFLLFGSNYLVLAKA